MADFEELNSIIWHYNRVVAISDMIAVKFDGYSVQIETADLDPIIIAEADPLNELRKELLCRTEGVLYVLMHGDLGTVSHSDNIQQVTDEDSNIPF